MSGRRGPPGEHLIMGGSRSCSPTQQREPYAGARAASVRMASGVGSPLSGERVVVSIFPSQILCGGGMMADPQTLSHLWGDGQGYTLLSVGLEYSHNPVLFSAVSLLGCVCVCAHKYAGIYACVSRPEETPRHHFLKASSTFCVCVDAETESPAA